MNLFKKGIFALLVTVLVISCDDEFEPIQPSLNSNGQGISEITFSSFDATSGPDADGLNDGTYITVDPLAIGVTHYEVDFGHGAPVTVQQIDGKATASYDYPNTSAQATYTITVTAKSDKGLADVTLSQSVVVKHTPPAVTSVPSSPTHRDGNVFAIFSNGFEYDGAMYSWEHGEDASGGTSVTPVEGNDVLQLSYLGNASAALSMDEVVIADTFVPGAASTHIHFDVHSEFASGVDVLKVSLHSGSTAYELDGLSLTDSEWTTFSFDLASDFSSAVTAIDKIVFEVGTGGTANDHGTIHVDNVFLSKPTGNMILNGDFNDNQEMWKFPIFTDGTTNPFGSSSDGSDLDYDGVDTGGKTRGAKWSSSQSGGALRSSASRYAYQELLLSPNTDYVLEYQYAIKDDSGDDPIGGRRLVGLVMDGYYVDGAKAADELHSNNLAAHVGKIAEGKFSSTAGDVGTFVSLPFTTGDSGEVAVMFYAVTPKDAYIDNVKVLPAP